MNNDEKFIELINYPGYRISNYGNLQSCLKRKNRICILTNEWHIIKARQNKLGYYRANIRDKNNKIKTVNIHKLVMEAFVGERPKGLVICHNNGICFDNRLENLRYDTVQGNSDDKYKHNTVLFGEDNNKTKLTVIDIQNMRIEHDNGESASKIANDFNITREYLYKILNGDRRMDAGGPLSIKQTKSNGKPKFTKEEANNILYLSEYYPVHKIAEVYKCNYNNIYRIVKGKRYKKIYNEFIKNKEKDNV